MSIKSKARVFVKQRYSQERLLNDIETTYLNLMEKVPAEDKYLLLQQKCIHQTECIILRARSKITSQNSRLDLGWI